MTKTRKPLSSARPSRKFFVVASAPNARFDNRVYTFLESLRFSGKNPVNAKRFYSKNAAEKFLQKAEPNPNMDFRVYRMLETRDGISIHGLDDSKGLKNNPSRKRRTRRATSRPLRRNPAPSRESRVAKLDRIRGEAYKRYQATEDTRHEHAYGRLTDMLYRAKEGDRSWYKGRPMYRPGAKPTASQIRAAVEKNGSPFFSKETLKYFGQTMSDFRVFRSKKTGRIFVGAPSRKQKGYYSLHEFTGKRLNSVKGAPSHWSDVKEWVNKQ